MGRGLKIALITLLVALVIAYFLFKDQLTGSVGKPSILGMNCISVNRTVFGSRWKENSRPSGDLNKIAATYLEGDPHFGGSVVGGFFKAIDVYPTKSRATFFKKQIKQYAEQVGLPWWEVPLGALACNYTDQGNAGAVSSADVLSGQAGLVRSPKLGAYVKR